MIERAFFAGWMANGTARNDRALAALQPNWHELTDRTKCQASSQRGDGECWWRYCPAKAGNCPLPQEEYLDE